jgi:hypothetical protein
VTKDEEIRDLRKLLYECVVELSYVQEAEVHSQCASAKGKYLVDFGMKVLGVKDLSAESLP